MNIRENLVNSTQPALVVKAFLLSIIILLVWAAVEWNQLDEFDTYRTRSDWMRIGNPEFICKFDHLNKEQWSEITDKAAYDLCVYKENQRIKSEIDRERAAIFVKVKASGFIPYFYEDYLLVGYEWGGTAILYFLMFTYVFYAKYNNLGWKRVSIIFAFIAAFVVAFIMYDEAGSRINDEEVLFIYLGALVGFISGIYIILVGRLVVVWIKEGFNPPQ